MDTPSPNAASPPAVPITPEQRAALVAGDGVAEFFDPQNGKVYVTTEEPAPIEVSPEIAALLQVGLDQIDRGDVVEWDYEGMLQKIDAWAERGRE